MTEKKIDGRRNLVKVILLSSLGTGFGVEFARIKSLSLLNFNIIVGSGFIIFFQLTFWFSFFSLIKTREEVEVEE